MSSSKKNRTFRFAASVAGVLMAATAISSGAQAQITGLSAGTQAASSSLMGVSNSVPGTLNSMFAAALPTGATTYLSLGVTTANLNVRSGPSASYPARTYIPKGTTINLYYKHTSTGWYHVKYGSYWGWVSPSFVRSIGASPYVNKYTGPNRTSRVVLTFDDCPNTLSAFDAATIYARDNGIGLVLAPTGNCISQFKSKYGVDIASRARARGHYVINHSVTHTELTRLSYSGVIRELGYPGTTTNMGRPPYGSINATVNAAYAAVGMYQWLWDVNTRDWQNRSKATTIYNAVHLAKPGSTVLMHMQWYGFSPDSLRQIKAGLANRGVGVCRPYRGYDNAGAVLTSPYYIPQSLPC